MQFDAARTADEGCEKCGHQLLAGVSFAPREKEGGTGKAALMAAGLFYADISIKGSGAAIPAVRTMITRGGLDRPRTLGKNWSRR